MVVCDGECFKPFSNKYLFFARKMCMYLQQYNWEVQIENGVIIQLWSFWCVENYRIQLQTET